MIKKILLLIMFYSFLCCSNPNKNKDFKEILFENEGLLSIDSKSFQLKNFGDSIRMPNSILCLGDKLIVNELGGNGLFHVFNVKSEEYIGLFGEKGRGPGEMASPITLNKIDSKIFQTYDLQLNKLVVFNIDSLIIKKQFKTELNLGKLLGITSALTIGDSIYSLSNLKSDHRIYVSDLDGKIVNGLGEIPVENHKITERMLAEGHSGNIQFLNNLFAFGYLTTPLIQIYNLKTKKWVLIKGPEKFPSIFKENDNDMMAIAYTKETKQAYVDIKISDNYIYALYNGKKLFDSSSDPNSYTIYIFDLDGTPFKQIKLEKGIAKFDVFQDKYIYGIHINSQFKFEIHKINILN